MFHRRTPLVSFLMFCLASIVSPIANAQVTNVTNSTSTPIQGAGHDYIHLLSETVDPANGSVSVRLAVPTPPGRQISLPFSFAYDSNGVNFPFDNGQGTAFAFWSTSTGFLSSSGGWSYSMPKFGNTVGSKPADPGQTGSCVYTIDYIFQDPSGGRHALGLAKNSRAEGVCAGLGNSITAGGDDLFRASSASGLSVASADGTVYTLGTLHTVSSHAGTTTEEGLASSIEDRNGNIIKITDLNGTGASAGNFTVTDTLGRTLLSASGFGTTGNTLTAAGLSPYTVTWGTAPSNFTVTSNSSVGCSVAPETGSAPVITALSLPNGKQFTFSYDLTYGQLSKITYPSGGYVSYAWGLNPQSAAITIQVKSSNFNGPCGITYDKPALLHRYVSFDGSTIAFQQDFSYTTTGFDPNGGGFWATKQTTVTNHDLVRGTTFTTIYSYTPIPAPVQPYDLASADAQIPLERTITYNDATGATLRTITKGWFDQYELDCQLETLENGTTTSGTFYNYDHGAQVSNTNEYDYGEITTSACATYPASLTQPDPSAVPVRQTTVLYAMFAPTQIFPSTPSIFDRPAEVVVFGNETGIAETDYAYDGNAIAGGSLTLPSGTHDPNYSQTYNVRGNASTVTKKCLPTCIGQVTSAVTSYVYDETGQVLSMTDACGNTSCGDMTGTGHTYTYSYNDSYTTRSGNGNVTFTPTANTNAYLTLITDPLGHTQRFTYDFNNGRLTISKDQNNQVTNYIYNDAWDRLTEAQYPDSGDTKNCYTDAGGPTCTQSTVPPYQKLTTKLATPSPSQTTTTVFDGMGHVTQTQLTSDTNNGTDYVDTTYDGLGRVYKSSNPHRSAASGTDGTTTYIYDSIGRICVLVPSDGTAVTTNTCPTARPTADVLTTYTANTATVTDEVGITRKSATDALGRLTDVWEDPAGLNYHTTYTYDALGNLLSVSQNGDRNRTFVYDGLSRLTSATNPESGTVTYSYDNNSNLAGRTGPTEDIKNAQWPTVTTTYVYDVVNRLIQKSYSDTNIPSLPGTPTVAYSYDQTSVLMCAPQSFPVSNSIGRVTSSKTTDKNGNPIAMTAYGYDAIGRTTLHYQCPPLFRANNQDAHVSYTYDLAGNLTSVLNGASVTLSYTYDGAGRATKATSSLVDAQHPATIVTVDSSAGFWPTGALRKLAYGNGLTENIVYNRRMQYCRYNLTSTSSALLNLCTDGIPSGNLLDLNYTRGLFSVDNGDVYTLTATGTQTFARTYNYDTVNRLKSMTDSAPGQACQGLSWTYDAWGDRTSQLPTAGSCFSQPATTFSSLNQFPSPYVYDNAGNVLTDGSNAYQHDAENRLTNVTGVSTYIYNADGQRVEKRVGTTTTDYVYDLAGNVISEFGTSCTAPCWQVGYIYFAGQQVAQYRSGTTSFIHKDELGSTRLATAVNATVSESNDYYPFGEFVSSGSVSKYKFTGKERDTESGLDNFGARYFGSTLGRFMSPDGPFSDQNTENPQSWNLYTYARNNPLRFTDADGRACVQQDDGSFNTVGTEGQSCEDAAKEDQNVNPSVIVTPSHDDQIKMFAEDIGNIGTAELKQDVLIMAVGAVGVAADAGIGILGARGAVARGGIAPVLKGAAGVARAEAEVAAEGGQVLGEEVTIQNSAGKARADFVYRDANGNLVVGEAKNGPTAALNQNQKAVYGQFEQGGGQFVGGNARQAGLPQSVGPTQVRVFKY